MSDQSDQHSCKLVTVQHVKNDFGGSGVWIAYCGNGPAHGLLSGHYPLYQGGSQDEASNVGIAHAKATGHQTYVWKADNA